MATTSRSTKTILALLFIFLLAAFLRLYKISDLAGFNYDEARDATIEREMIVNHKWTLLGPETKIGDKVIYFGPLHFYLMAPALAISDFDPLGPYIWTAIIGTFTVILIYLLTHNLLSAAFYAAFPIAVIYNRWAWNPNTVPFFAALYLLLLSRKRYLLAGIALGLGIELHFTVGLLLLVVPFIIKNRKINKFLKIALGIIIGLSPLILFDLRHDFLYLKSSINLITSSSSWSYRTVSWHYFLWALPLLAWWLKFWPKIVSLVAVAISFCVSLFWLLSRPPEIARNPKIISQIAKIISADQKQTKLNFDVASFVDPDTRATAYRYFLALDGVRPLSEREYSVADHLYVITFETPGEVLYNKTYEISSLQPKRISKSWKIAGENIYRLERN